MQWLVLGVVAALALVAFFLWKTNDSVEKTNVSVEKRMESGLSVEVISAREVITDQYKMSGMEPPPLPEIYERVYRHLDKKHGQKEGWAKAKVAAETAATMGNPHADAFAKSQAAQIAGKLDEADKEAGIALREAREKFKADDAKNRTRLFECFKQRGLILVDKKEYAKAIENYQEALAVITREKAQTQWAELQFLLGKVESTFSEHSEGPAVKQHIDAAITAYRNATREGSPEDWARTQNNLAIALSKKADISEKADDKQRLLDEAITACRNVLQVDTREGSPQNWAATQYRLANALRSRADISEKAEDKRRFLDEAIAAYRNALQVLTREGSPKGWAATQNNLAIALSFLADVTVGKTEELRLRKEAIACAENALKVYTEKDFSDDHKQRQSLLGLLRQKLAEAEEKSTPPKDEGQ
jgi:tetratricopeptide (TPR) repeat protein